MFVELAARTCFSFLRGGSAPAAVVARAAELGYDTIGIADCDGLYGIVRALQAASETRGIRVVAGCELALEGAPSIWLHVATMDGYANLCRLLTESHALHPRGKPRRLDEDVPRNQFAGIPIDRVCAAAEGLWCTAQAERAEDAAALKAAFGDRLSIAAWRHRDGEDDARVARAEATGRALSVPVCATNRVLYARREDKPVLDVLHCIREGVTLDAAGRALSPNAEAHVKSPAAIERLFADRPAWIARSREVADACAFSMWSLKYQFPYDLDPDLALPGEQPSAALRRLTFEGARARYPSGMPDSVRRQVDKELTLIEKMNVAPYFLSVLVVVKMAAARRILCQGRGSAANSAVCYCLGITAVAPEKSNLLFERFLSEERNEPPDIDVDFEHERREEVIQAIYAKYGRRRAAMVSEVISYRAKSALRDVGKAFGLSLEQVERLSGLVAWWDKLDEVDDDRIAACDLDPGDARVRHVLAMAHAIQGYPRHLSIHVGGFVLSSEDLVKVAPIEPATMPDRTVIPWDKDDLDALHFFKIDVLGLGMLTAIRKALAMVHGDPSDASSSASSLSPSVSPNDRLAAIPQDDERVYAALCNADTVGVFQIESRAQMAMLPRLRPKVFYDLVVQVAIVRPGPIQGGMVHPYLRRRAGKEEAESIHPDVDPILERTLGVPLFQEQVMQLAIAGAGYSGGEADELRRDMAAWRRNGKLAQHRERLLEGFAKKGIARAFGERLYQSIQGFGEYGFPESHAASFALLVYASAWLKVHHPAAFAAALINSQPMGFYSPGSIVEDAQRHGVVVRRVCAGASDWDCTLEASGGEAPALRLGLCLVKGLRREAGQAIGEARRARAFEGVDDLTDRAGLAPRDVDALAYAGALAGFGLERREAMWKARTPRETGLFAGVDLGDAMPELPPLSRAQQLLLDYERTGVAVGDHAMRLVRPTLPAAFKSARDLVTLAHGARVSTAGMVICRQRPQTASGVVFVTLEDETGFVNLILWARMFDRWRHVTTTSTILAAHGVIEREEQVVYVVPERLEKVPLPGLRVMSRDFH